MEGEILLSRLDSVGLSSGQAGHQLLQHVTSKLADHFVKDVGHAEVSRCWTVSGKVVRVSAVEKSVVGEVAGTGMVHIYGDRGWEHQRSSSQL